MPGKDNILKAKAWAIFCWPEKDWNRVDSLLLLHKQSKVLCGAHFEESCFLDSSKKKISKFAVPGMRNLREQAVSGEQQGSQSLITPTAGPSRQQDPLSPACKEIEGSQSLILPVAGSSRQQDTLTPACKEIESSQSLILPVAGSSRQQDTLSPAFKEIESSQSLILPVAGSSRQQDTLSPAFKEIEGSQSLILPVAGSSRQQDALTPARKEIEEITRAKKTTRVSILNSLNVEKLSQLSKTERQLYGICKRTYKEINRLRKNLRNKKKINKIEKYCDSEHIKKLLKLNLSNSFVLLLQSQMKNCPKKPKGRRYSLDEKILALGIYKKSPATYRLLRRFIALPSQSTLIKLLNRVPLRPGVNAQIFNGLKEMAEKQIDEENLCVLLFDEMAIKKSLNYNIRLDLVEGFQDHGREHGRSNQVACNALVFMVCGIRKKWKQPVAFYLSGKSVTSDRLHILIKEILTDCFKAGINVLGTVCDMASVNIKALEKLGATSEKPYFSHSGKEVVTIADPPHLLKCTRNMFLAHNIECNLEMQLDGRVVKGTAKWNHIKDFYELDKCNPHFVFAPALSDKHINPNSKQKMRVKLAAQIFSHSVTAGILAKVSTGALPPDALATSTLLKKFDDLFDALNADTPDARRGKKFSTNMSSHSPHHKLFEEMKFFIKSLKFVGTSRDPPSKSGWIMTINAIERLWKNLNNLGVHSLSTRRLNQDPLENLFGCVRYNSGSNCNPTVSQFIAGIKTAIISNLRNSSTRKNCEDDSAILAYNLKAFLTTPAIEKRHDFAEELDVVHDTVEDVFQMDMASPEAQACAYVCGFIVKRMRKETCKSCKKALLAPDSNESSHIFTSFKEYDGEKQSLKYVTTDLVNAVESSATIVNNIFEVDLWKENIKSVAISALKKVNLNFLNRCKNHAKINSDFILKSVFFIVLKRCIVLKNRGFSEDDEKKQLQRKLKILKNQ